MIDCVRVNEILLDCFYKENETINGEPIVEPIYIRGVAVNVGLYPPRVEQHKNEIIDMLRELPEMFKEGWSFLNLCMTKNDELWTGSHKSCDELMILDMAIGKIEYCSDNRKFWKILPSGMPYIKVKDIE